MILLRGCWSACQQPSPISAPRYGQRPTANWFPNHKTLNHWIMWRPESSAKKKKCFYDLRFLRYMVFPLLCSRNRNCLPNIWMCPLVMGLKLPHESNITWVLFVSVMLIVVHFDSFHMRAWFSGLLFACSRKRRGLVQLRQRCSTPPDAELGSDRLPTLLS